MVFKQFCVQLGLRIALLTLTLTGWVYLFFTPAYPILHLLLTALVLLQVYKIYRYVIKTNTELVRFLDAARYADFGQRFEMPQMGAGFEELGSVFTGIVEQFQTRRTRQEQDLRHLRALTEHVPVPLLSLHPDDRVELHNNAARRLFGNVRVTRLEDFNSLGDDFASQMLALKPGERRLAVLQLDGIDQQLTLSATEVVIAGKMEKLISLQNIQSELDGVQLQAWQDLVRVLTHEIMNSITPVASLARTATGLVEDVLSKVDKQPALLAELADVQSAVTTVARRSDGLMQFVQSYRRLTRLPPPELQLIALADLFARVEELLAADWAEQGMTLSLRVDPKSLELTADPDMIEQVLLNILRNAEQALAGRECARADVLGSLNRQGHVCIEISDNGPGVAADLAKNIFVPFFTTKRDGSGVGLALTRQVMLAHGGTVTLGSSDSAGAKFTLSFAANRTG